MEPAIESDIQKLTELQKKHEETTVNKKTIKALDLSKENEIFIGDDEYITKYNYFRSQLKKMYYFTHGLPSCAFVKWIDESTVCVASDKPDSVTGKFKMVFFMPTEAKVLFEAQLESA